MAKDNGHNQIIALNEEVYNMRSLMERMSIVDNGKGSILLLNEDGDPKKNNGYYMPVPQDVMAQKDNTKVNSYETIKAKIDSNNKSTPYTEKKNSIGNGDCKINFTTPVSANINMQEFPNIGGHYTIEDKQAIEWATYFWGPNKYLNNRDFTKLIQNIAGRNITANQEKSKIDHKQGNSSWIEYMDNNEITNPGWVKTASSLGISLGTSIAIDTSICAGLAVIPYIGPVCSAIYAIGSIAWAFFEPQEEEKTMSEEAMEYIKKWGEQGYVDCNEILSLLARDKGAFEEVKDYLIAGHQAAHINRNLTGLALYAWLVDYGSNQCSNGSMDYPVSNDGNIRFIQKNKCFVFATNGYYDKRSKLISYLDAFKDRATFLKKMNLYWKWRENRFNTQLLYKIGFTNETINWWKIND